VGRGFSAIIQTPMGKWILIDLGASDSFSPVTDFILPRLKAQKATRKDGRYEAAQLIISHPHDDHMTSLEEFDKHIYPVLLTVPNSVNHPKQPPGCKVNWALIRNPSEDLTKYLREKMIPGREPPLRGTDQDKSKGFVFKIYYIKPSTCENDKDLSLTNYPNNISIMARLNYKGKVVLFCGDMMKDGMTKIISSDDTFSQALAKNGVDYLLAPHHGLRSSFSTDLFSTMKEGKTRALNIISERPTKKDSNEIVDSRYGLPDYCLGKNNLKRTNGKKVRQLRTSASGHTRIIIFENGRSLVTTGVKALSAF